MSTSLEAPQAEAMRRAPVEPDMHAEAEMHAKAETETTAPSVWSPPKGLRRRGDVSKCPICGSSVDPEAFHCPHCHNYFCFHCRARLLPSDVQLQCRDQNCDYYAKPLCNVCDPPIVQEEAPSVFVEPLDGYWPIWLIVSLIVGGLSWYYYWAQWLPSALTALGVFVLGGNFIHNLGLNIFGGRREIVEQRTSTYHTCIRCHQRVKEVPGTA
jgi:hypothetical protein